MKQHKESQSVRTPNTEYRELQQIPGYAIGEDGSFISLAKKVPCFKAGEKEPYRWVQRAEHRMTIDKSLIRPNGSHSYKALPTVNGKRVGHSIARLVLLAFKGNPPTNDSYLAWSLNRDSSNANLGNLKWVLRTDTVLVTSKSGKHELLLKPDAVLH